ncbi:hypothetical protein [Sandaracinus amylolyticus]|uniref:hypothetical protein n=1 Tax=Sandaracinus amylolyticus TaxID=927083 RepID=UPI001F27FE2C|nr:hypothetical protein [Sandaracinus amylolyticus]UJR81674.1 Hypothetical protein I5071_37340 [Sandaracinus amylolyticus]
MQFGVRFGMCASLALGLGCGPGSASTAAEPTSGGELAAVEQPPSTSEWLNDVPPGGTLSYDVAVGDGAPRRVQMRVQEIVRRGAGIAVLLAPVGTPLDEEPVYARWIVADQGELVGLDEHAALTTEPGYAPIDDAGRILTEAAETVAWRLPRDWLTPGVGVAGEEVSAGWRLAERVGDLSTPIAGRGCARLERDDAGERATLTVCANLGLVESTLTTASGTAGARWTLVAIDGPPEAGVEIAAE